MLQPHNITFPIYAESEQEAHELEAALKDFVKKKYSQQVYPRAAAITNLIRRYGNNAIINNFIR